MASLADPCLASLQIGLCSLLAIAACGSNAQSELIEELTPAMQSTLDRHGDRLGPSLRLVPAEITERLCADDIPAINSMPLLTRELAESVVAKTAKVMSKSKESLPFFTHDPFTTLLGGGYKERSALENAMMVLDAATVAGVLVTVSYESPQVSGRTITRLGRFEGWFVVLDLRAARVLAQVPVEADSESMLQVKAGTPDDLAVTFLHIGHEDRIITAANAALAASCPRVRLREPTK